MVQCVAVCCSGRLGKDIALNDFALIVLNTKDSNALQCVAMCCSVLQCVAVCCSVLQCVAVRCLFCFRCRLGKALNDFAFTSFTVRHDSF